MQDRQGHNVQRGNLTEGYAGRIAPHFAVAHSRKKLLRCLEASCLDNK